MDLSLLTKKVIKIYNYKSLKHIYKISSLDEKIFLIILPIICFISSSIISFIFAIQNNALCNLLYSLFIVVSIFLYIYNPHFLLCKHQNFQLKYNNKSYYNYFISCLKREFISDNNIKEVIEELEMELEFEINDIELGFSKYYKSAISALFIPALLIYLDKNIDDFSIIMVIVSIISLISPIMIVALTVILNSNKNKIKIMMKYLKNYIKYSYRKERD